MTSEMISPKREVALVIEDLQRSITKIKETPAYNYPSSYCANLAEVELWKNRLLNAWSRMPAEFDVEPGR